MQRYFAPKKTENKFELYESDIHHIKKVMRMKPNDEIIVIYEKNSYLCYINDNFEIIEKQKLEQTEENIYPITLIVPVLKEQKLDYILQKSTELGVFKIVLYYSKRGIVKENEKSQKKLNRWNLILKEASEQSHRNSIPKLEIMSFEDITKLDGISIFCSTNEKENTIKNTLKSINNCDKINILMGPEGGISREEEQKLLDNNFIPVSLGSRILRVETVPLYLMSIVNYECMR